MTATVTNTTTSTATTPATAAHTTAQIIAKASQALPHKFVVGLTGGIGAGKTSIAREFIALGITEVDADQIARAVVAPGQPLLASIVAAFGSDMLLADGSLHRQRLRQLIFSDSSAKATLNGLMHPAIRQALLQALTEAQSDYVLLTAPLLLENGLQAYVDTLLVIDVTPEVQMARTIARDKVDRSQVEAILAAQCSRQERCRWADHVIDNNAPLNAARLQELQLQILHLDQIYRQMARKKLAD